MKKLELPEEKLKQIGDGKVLEMIVQRGFYKIGDTLQLKNKHIAHITHEQPINKKQSLYLATIKKYD